MPASRPLIAPPEGLLYGSWYEVKAQCAAVLLAHCSLFVRRFLVKNTNSDTSSVESTQLAAKQTTIILPSKTAI